MLFDITEPGLWQFFTGVLWLAVAYDDNIFLFIVITTYYGDNLFLFIITTSYGNDKFVGV